MLKRKIKQKWGRVISSGDQFSRGRLQEALLTMSHEQTAEAARARCVDGGESCCRQGEDDNLVLENVPVPLSPR